MERRRILETAKHKHINLANSPEEAESQQLQEYRAQEGSQFFLPNPEHMGNTDPEKSLKLTEALKLYPNHHRLPDLPPQPMQNVYP